MGEFNKEKTNYCKGIAIVLMIIHHLYWNVPNIGIKFDGIAISQRIGILGKVCVSIFLMLSGYGVYKSNKKIKKISFYYSHRLVKIYTNYLFVVIFSLIIGYVFFNQEITAMLGTGIKAMIKIIITMSGLQFFIGYQGFNGSWWFVTLILFCYILYPYIEKKIKIYGSKFLIFCFLISFLNEIKLGKFQLFNLIFWLFPFVLGVYIAHSNFLYKSYKYIKSKVYRKILLIMTLIVLCLIRQGINPQANLSLRIDWILSFIFIIFVNIFYEDFKISKNIICSLGKLSMDMYYVHMFITTYYIGWLTYSFKYPIVSILFCVILSYLSALFIQKLKEVIKFYKFEHNMEIYFSKLGEKKVT